MPGGIVLAAGARGFKTVVCGGEIVSEEKFIVSCSG
jgi:hypothetical protein